MNGKNPTIAPANAVINTIAISGELFNENIISNDKHDIKQTPEESPSNPSIRLIAFVIPTIQQIVRIYENTSLIIILLSVKGNLKFSILIPAITTIIPARI